jgi:hypothetical protein
MDIKEAKRKKRNQVLQLFIAAIFIDLLVLYIYIDAPKDNIVNFLKYIFTGKGYGWARMPPDVVIIVALITNIWFIWELKEYLQRNYKLWRTGK